MAEEATREAATSDGQMEFPLTAGVVSWFVLHGRVIPNHPQLHVRLRNT